MKSLRKSSLTPLAFLTIIAVLLRSLPLRFRYLLGYDPYFHLAYIEEALKAGEWFNFFTLANGPWGFQVRDFHPLGLWMTPAYIYKILSVFGVSLYDAFRITPVIFGVLTIIFFYLALRKFYGDKKAFFSALFLALSFGHVFRSMANYYRGDNYMLFWYSIALLGIALAFSADKEKWGHKRLLFYLVPAFASGLASIFWQAYYPIFIFLILSGMLLAIGSFLLNEQERLLDSLALILSTALGAFIANFLGGKFGYGMLGYTGDFGRSIAAKLGVEFGLIKDAYLLVHLYYLVPLALVFVILLLLLSKFVKDKKAKVRAILGLAAVSILIFLLKFPALKELSSVFGMFEGVPIMETSPTTFQDLWNAFSISLFLSPLFLLRFRPGRVKLVDFLLLGLIIPSLYMLSTWSRFVSIGSLAVALMVGAGVVEAYELIVSKLENKKAYGVVLALLILLPTINGVFTFENVLNTKPFMNEAWEDALTWLGNNSNENDIVLAWWDYGAWITYYSRRSPLAEIAPNPDVALYYLGKRDENWAINLGVDYVIVSYYDFLKFDAIVQTASAHPSYNISERYGLVVLPLTLSYGGILAFERGEYKILAKPGEKWDVRINLNGKTISPKKLFVEYHRDITTPELAYSNTNTYLYVNLDYKYAIFMNEEAFNTPLVRLFINASEPYELVYSDGGLIKILKLKHPNVRIERTESKVIFKFENAVGTKLKIWGFLDNGTAVFEGEYNVENKTELELPEEVEGDVVRYAYMEGEKILDRGIFRRD
ncbi:glycosyltransferase family 39 protein [Thermococcus aggregans]|uniref:dolichyl-phosphooligosaccharide-protein glycotransferase n=1 Tax=Thermococcus aggregans TaxID=110163 RepID=A0A9E7MYG4_THEAG|nr:glycosyltransferase family 39 protein [Thermococcus aggregans]USS41089.1 glycosyltransferase family 39 protein [Thermococcus aggregans]